MTIVKKVDDIINVGITIEHRGEAMDVVAYWDIAPGHPTEGWQHADAFHLADATYSIPRSPNNGANWQAVTLDTLSDTYPGLAYKTVNGIPYLKADCRIGIYKSPLDLTTSPILQETWEDVYELTVISPEFRNLGGSFS